MDLLEKEKGAVKRIALVVLLLAVLAIAISVMSDYSDADDTSYGSEEAKVGPSAFDTNLQWTFYPDTGILLIETTGSDANFDHYSSGRDSPRSAAIPLGIPPIRM